MSDLHTLAEAVGIAPRWQNYRYEWMDVSDDSLRTILKALGFRPEAIQLVGPGQGVPVVVNVVEQLGSDAFLYTKLASEHTDDVLHPSDIVVRTEPRTAAAAGHQLFLGVREGGLHVFDPSTQQRVD